MVQTSLFDLTGKVALLTGASKGMGKAMAQALAEHGARVMISSRKLDQCQAVADEINASCGAGRALAFACNAGYKEQLQALVNTTREKLGPIDIVVGNAGINPFYGGMFEISDEAYDKIMATNVRSNLWLAKMVAPDMAAKGAGSMMFTASVGAFGPVAHAGHLQHLEAGGHRPGAQPRRRTRPAGHPRQRDLPGPDPHRLRAGALGQPRGRETRARADSAAPPGRGRGPEGPGGVPRLGRQRLHHRPGDHDLRRQPHARLRRAPP
jgi:NAD(P)-dependent dehydrogenase (short-subunit alcohol dehydrogenase family)